MWTCADSLRMCATPFSAGRGRAGAAPALVIEGEETAHFEGDRIRRLEDRFTGESAKEATRWLEKHGSQMKPAPAD